MLSAEIEWPCEPAVVARARDWTQHQLSPGLPGWTSERADDAVLCVSELVTNALNAGSTRVKLAVDLRAGTLTLSLCDDAGGWPVMVPPASLASHGRGLVIVATLSQAWGATPRNSGKLVWAVLSW